MRLPTVYALQYRVCLDRLSQRVVVFHARGNFMHVIQAYVETLLSSQMGQLGSKLDIVNVFY